MRYGVVKCHYCNDRQYIGHAVKRRWWFIHRILRQREWEFQYKPCPACWGSEQ